MELAGTRDKPAGFFNPTNPARFSFATSDLAFSGDYAFAGNFNGFNIYDLSEPGRPDAQSPRRLPGRPGRHVRLREPALHVGRGDAAAGSTAARRARPAREPRRFRGVRIFDVSDITNPVQVAAVQTCRGSHTHTLVTDPDDPDNVYVYVSGHRRRAPGAELAGCNSNTAAPDDEPVALAHRGHQGAARRAAARPAIVERAAAVRRPGDRAPSTACRTRRRRRGTRRASRGRRRRSPTPATTSPPSRRSGSPPAPARATASSSTSPTRSTRSGSTRSPTRTSPTGTRRRSTTTAPR